MTSDEESRFVRQTLGRIEGRLDAIDQRIADVRQVIVSLDAEHKESRQDLNAQIAEVKRDVEMNRQSQRADDLRRRRLDMWSTRSWQMFQAVFVAVVSVLLTVYLVG